MNKVLIICSNFVPVRNGGTIRCEKLVKYLPEYGWQTVVLTKKPSKKQRLDHSLLLDHCTIYRTNRFDIASSFVQARTVLKNLLKKSVRSWKTHKYLSSSLNTNSLNTKRGIVTRRVVDYFVIPDSDIFWALTSVFKGFWIVKKEKPA